MLGKALKECEKKWWKRCVEKKCKSASAGSKTSCPKDADCESYCTEEGSSTGGLIGCCVGGASRDDAECPSRKRVDGECAKKLPPEAIAKDIPPIDPEAMSLRPLREHPMDPKNSLILSKKPKVPANPGDTFNMPRLWNPELEDTSKSDPSAKPAELGAYEPSLHQLLSDPFEADTRIFDRNLVDFSRGAPPETETPSDYTLDVAPSQPSTFHSMPFMEANAFEPGSVDVPTEPRFVTWPELSGVGVRANYLPGGTYVGPGTSFQGPVGPLDVQPPVASPPPTPFNYDTTLYYSAPSYDPPPPSGNWVQRFWSWIWNR